MLEYYVQKRKRGNPNGCHLTKGLFYDRHPSAGLSTREHGWRELSDQSVRAYNRSSVTHTTYINVPHVSMQRVFQKNNLYVDWLV